MNYRLELKERIDKVNGLTDAEIEQKRPAREAEVPYIMLLYVYMCMLF